MRAPLRVELLVSFCLMHWPHAVLAGDELAGRECARTMTGRVICPPPGGSIAVSPVGNAVCGRGECLKDASGQWMCAREPGGHVGRNPVGQVVCTGGCEPASDNLCEEAR
jgi:hypothetical protein